jgi:hypothetical protein
MPTDSLDVEAFFASGRKQRQAKLYARSQASPHKLNRKLEERTAFLLRNI